MFIDIERATDEEADRKTEQGQEARDLVAEARELLTKVTLPAEMNARSRELLPLLCDEVEAHQKHLEFCFHNHVMESQLTKLRNAARAVLPFLDAEIERRGCVTHDQPTHCVDCDLRHKAQKLAKNLRDAM